ncbi:hypothetical protein AVEN_270262-1 [Araneus ventricosus]|uniref:Uncharacterized protein n=1 Tax=Araneus ventricosus TaxID=182803 RepID=A0A4Y2F4X2_ARAVE|nr:hypothetical protein AVEN_270262-1 [Araneus ventricosus]
MDHNRFEDLISILLNHQCSIQDNVQDGVSTNGHTGPDHNSASTKWDTLVQKCRIIPSATFPPDDNAPNFRLSTKAGLVCEEQVSSTPLETICDALVTNF